MGWLTTICLGGGVIVGLFLAAIIACGSPCARVATFSLVNPPLGGVMSPGPIGGALTTDGVASSSSEASASSTITGS